MGKLLLGQSKGGLGALSRWQLNRGLSSHSFLQLFKNFDCWPLYKGWPRNRCSKTWVLL